MKQLVPNIPFRSYLASESKREYDFYLLYGKFEAKDLFNFGAFEDLSFGFVKDIQEILNYQGLTWEIFFREVAKEKKHSIEYLAGLPIFDLQQARLYFKEQIEHINQLETNNLSYHSTGDEAQAGLEDFSKYRSFIQFDKLADGDVLKFDEIAKQPYAICFTKLLLEKDKTEYQQRLNRLYERKH